MSQEPVADPAKTAALVVGVEKSQVFGWPELVGVGADARRFASWLVRRGVPPGRLLLHLAEVTPDGPLSVDVGGQAVEVAALDANYQSVWKSFLETIPGWVGAVDLLIVYWAGHGYIDEDLKRWLECADSQHDRRRAFPFDELVATVRGQTYPKYLAAFVDACAIDLRLIDSEARPGGERFTRAVPNREARQFILYSSREGQFATYLNGDELNSFSGVLLAALSGEDSTTWPPCMPRVAGLVKAHFEALRVAGKTDQIPVFANVSWDGDVTDSGLFRLAASSRGSALLGHTVSLDDVATLAGALGSLDFLTDASNRAALLRELPLPLSLDLSAADAAGFVKGLARNALDSPDLDPLLDALDRFPEVRDDPALADTVFPALDRPRRSPIGWFEVARLRRLLPVPGQPCGACPIDRDALDKVAVGFFRDLETNGLLGEISASVLLRPGAFVARLAALPLPEKKAPPLLRFVRTVEALAREPLRSKLNTWIGEVAGRLDVAVPPAAPAPPAAADVEPTRLVVCLQPSDYKKDHFAVNAWRIRWGRQVKQVGDHRELTRDEVVELIDTCLRNLLDNEPREVELFLPLEHLAEGVSRWEVKVRGKQKIGVDARFPVKLRCLDRIPPRVQPDEDIFPDQGSPFDQEARRLWRERWANRPGASQPLSAFCAPLRLDDQFEETLYEKWVAAGPVCVAESLVPAGSESDRALASAVLETLLLAGTPVVVWPGAGTAAHPPIYNEPDGTDHQNLWSFIIRSDRLEALPARVHNQRKKAGGYDPRPDWNLCLLLDDPDRPPPIDEYKDLYDSLGYQFA